MLCAVELFVIRNKAVIEVVQPRATYGTNKTALMEDMIFNSYTLKDFYRLATFGLVTPVGPD